MIYRSRHSKYGSIKANGCDSLKESRRLQQLTLLQKAGVIKDLKTQVKFVLIPTQYETYERYSKTGRRLKDGQKCIEKECAYYADFTYTVVETGEYVVEDTKGYKGGTAYDVFTIKRKLMLSVHGIRVKEV